MFAQQEEQKLSQRRRSGFAVAATVGALSMMVAGCGGSISGTATATTAQTVRHVDGNLSELLIEPERFPAPYEAIVLPPQAVAQAASDLSGIPSGAKVAPAGCKPPDRDLAPGGTVIAVGTDNANRATITIELTRVKNPLSVRKDQLGQCRDVTVTSSGATSTVHTDITPPPPVDADDSLALKQTVSSGKSGDSVKQRMLTLIAQVGDVQVVATYMTFGSAKPDAAALDQLFTEAVARVADA